MITSKTTTRARMSSKASKYAVNVETGLNCTKAASKCNVYVGIDFATVVDRKMHGASVIPVTIAFGTIAPAR